MTKLDEAIARPDGNYPVEICIKGEWIAMGLLNRHGVEKLCDHIDYLQDNGYMNTHEPAQPQTDKDTND